MGRKRSKENQWMPLNVKKQKGRFVLTNYQGIENGKRVYGKEIVLGPDTLSKAKVWQYYEETNGATSNLTLKALLNIYMLSKDFQSLTPRTQKDYNRYFYIIVSKPIADGLFGEVLADKVTPGTIRKYLDKRAIEGAPVGSNKEPGISSSAYSWGFNRDLVQKNPCKGVKRNTRNKRQHYVSDEDYYHAIFMPGPAYVPLVMELCYLCRLRQNEALKLTHEHVDDGMLYVTRGKGSKDSRISLSPRLEAVINACHALPLDVTPMHKAQLPLVHDQKGNAITIGALQSAWRRLMTKFKANGGNPFQIHDLKRKAVSDFTGDKLKASGHRDPKMLEIYDVLPDEVDATR